MTNLFLKWGRTSTVVAVMLMTLSGCATVRFNERERLSQPDMQFDADPLHAQFEAHVLQSRQGSAGSFSSSGGGGCGCF